jgi:hypothetical protein
MVLTKSVPEPNVTSATTLSGRNMSYKPLAIGKEHASSTKWFQTAIWKEVLNRTPSNPPLSWLW